MASQPARTHEEIEAQIKEIQAKSKASQQQQSSNGVPLSADSGLMDDAIYGVQDKFAEYVTSIAANDADEDDDDDESGGIVGSNGNALVNKIRSSVNAPTSIFKDVVDEVSIASDCFELNCGLTAISVIHFKQDHDPLAGNRVPRVIDREDEYRRRRLNNAFLSPSRGDPFLDGTVFHSLFTNHN